MKIGFGLDIGGYGKKDATILTAAIAKDGKAEVTILTNSAFSKKLGGDSDLLSQIDEERKILLRLVSIGPLAVDVPIDLQGLPSPPNVTRIWELTQRPIDRAFGGLAPVADKLGYCVARFLSVLTSNKKFKIGSTIYETYPAASLSICGIENKGYKKGEESPKVRISIAKSLKISDNSITHDELDSVICALAAIGSNGEILEAEALKKEMLRRLKTEANPSRHHVPKGYRLLGRVPSFKSIQVQRSPANAWLQQYLQ